MNDKVVTKDIHGPDSSRFGASLASGAFEAGNLELAIGAPDTDGGAGAVTLERWPATHVLQQGDGIGRWREGVRRRVRHGPGGR